MKTEKFRIDGTDKFVWQKADTKVKDLYETKEDYEVQLHALNAQMDELQSMMYAHGRYGLLVIFQAMDAAGKDSTIKKVFSGVNPAGIKVHSFKRPSETELAHDYLWRHLLALPERGSVAVFNRSYYEEVLVVKVHDEILKNVQKLPTELTENPEKVWKDRYEDIDNFEQFLYRNGTRIVKFFLHISPDEQASRLIERIEDSTKNWKFQEQDVKERTLWPQYMNAYEDCINKTASEHSPWYVIPADDKKNMRLLVSQVLINEMQQMDICYPEPTPERQAQLQQLIEVIRGQKLV
jgi:PPK2 family polyphosphate:nucleotide phosphotransferase